MDYLISQPDGLIALLTQHSVSRSRLPSSNDMKMEVHPKAWSLVQYHLIIQY